jgi:hypothetical protein
MKAAVFVRTQDVGLYKRSEPNGKIVAGFCFVIPKHSLCWRTAKQT